jgi:hypothetical protein
MDQTLISTSGASSYFLSLMAKLYVAASSRHVEAVRREYVGRRYLYLAFPPNQHRLAIVMSMST